MNEQRQPSKVSQKNKQGGETRYDWVEACAWTDRMLTALEKGVKGNKWFSLIDKVFKFQTLERAWARVKSNGGSPGIDGMTIEHFEANKERELSLLQRQLQSGSYRPEPVMRVWIPKPGSKEKRPLGIPTVRDRVVQAAVTMVIEPIFERDFAEHSYGFRPKRGCKDALRRVDNLLKQGYTWIVDADLRRYFDTIPHERLLRCVEEKIADGRVLKLIAQFLKQGVMEPMKEWTPTEAGTPQGAVLSPLLANIYLNRLDHELAERGYEMVRYADDFVILCRTREDAEAALEVISEWTRLNELTLHPEKTRLITWEEGFDFLGYHFKQGRRWPRKKSLQKIKDSIRVYTKRNNGRSLEAIIAKLNPMLRGWYGYFKHCYHRVFSDLDGWIRGRLRSILRRRQGRRGRARGRDHQRWPNRYFEEMGLFSLKTAHTLFCQSR